jgi:hypothetical protein
MGSREDINTKLELVSLLAKNLSKGGWWTQDLHSDVSRMQALLSEVQQDARQFDASDR